MHSSSDPSLSSFADVLAKIPSTNHWHYDVSSNRPQIVDIPAAVRVALRTPTDFPPLSAAIAPGDRVALAVDPNVPDIVEVVRGVLLEIDESEGDVVDIVLWDEATDVTVRLLEAEFENIAAVTRHDSHNRESLRYLGVDNESEPVYLNRLVVDADLVLPIVSARPWDAAAGNELSGVYPILADSNTRIRHQVSLYQPQDKKKASNESHIGWMLGVQLMMAVAANEDGTAGAIFAGTPDAIRRSFDQPRQANDEFPPAAPLVIASIEGSDQQQTWGNLARAVAVAATHVAAGGTLLLWTQIKTPPSDRLVHRMNTDGEGIDDGIENVESGDGFILWDDSLAIAKVMDRVGCEHRLLLHSKLDSEVVESLGIGAVESIAGLDRLTGSFESCGTMRAAQFAGGTFDHYVFQSSNSSQRAQ
ncbi:hypothetical protein CA13_72640 [Planctomycetes bacterium CA13]|uniref:LarA-like N-terminal domain-containing protein n=1 Tax=Novipirellula herctigrandis TaxID=2527986 RepID=A0A5C5YPE1_9BACT|nr:hypothetical protein CA13_72640 [Planctomycetes bacterium CA13]